MINELLPKVGIYDFLAEPFHCDFTKHLTIGHLGNHMLNAADFHSNDRGYGMSYLNALHKTWVLSRMAIEMEEMPVTYDKFQVETWIENTMKYFTSRNFKVVSSEGKVFGYGRSVWAMIDTDTRQPVDILSIHDGLINDYVVKDKECPIAAGSRVKMLPDAQFVRSINTYYNDVDVNGHINSVKYIEHILDLFDLPFYKSHKLKRFEIAYVAESHQGDKLNFYKEGEKENEYSIRITKSNENSPTEVEVVRSKVIFVKD
nr:acyl-[acyl-carrier-protein] thioesterase [Prevotella sp.]